MSLWHFFSSELYIAQAIAGNAATQISILFPDLGARLGSTTAYYTNNYLGSQVVVAKLESDLSIEFMAAALASAWGLGETISEFEPTNNRKRAESPEEVTGELSIKGGIISSAPYTPAEMYELYGLLQDMEDRSDEQTTGSLHRRQRRCPNIYLGNCGNQWWTPWNTQRSLVC